MRLKLAAAVLLSSGLARAASGGTPLAVTHTGFLLDSSDKPVTNPSLALTFRLVDHPAAVPEDKVAWQGTCTVAVMNGYYAVVLGGDGCVGDVLDTADLPTGQARYLEVTIGKETLTPRMQLNPAPLAQVAANAERLGGELAEAYLKRTELSDAGSLNDAHNPVDWTKLKGVPAGFDDGIDDDTTYSADGTSLKLDGTRFSIAQGGVDSLQIKDSAISLNKLEGGASAAAGQVLSTDGTQLVWTTPASYGAATDGGLSVADKLFALALGGVRTEHLATGAVTVDKIDGGAAAAVGTVPFRVDGGLQWAQVPVRTVGSGLALSNGQVSLAAGGVDSAQIKDNSITLGKLAGGTTATVGQVLTKGSSGLTWTSLAAGTGLTFDGATFALAASGVGTTQLANNAVTTPKLADLGVTNTKIADGAVSLAKLDPTGAATGQVLTRGATGFGWATPTAYTSGTGLALSGSQFSIATGGVGTAQLADANVTLAKLEGAAAATAGQVLTKGSTGIAWTTPTVYTAGTGLAQSGSQFSIAAAGVGTTQLADLAATTTKLADLAVTTAKLADSSVTAAKIADGAVGAAEIATGAVTLAKIDPTGATTGQVLSRTATGLGWTTPTAYTSGTGLTLTGTQFAIANGGVGTTQLADANVTLAKLEGAAAATTGQVPSKGASGIVWTTPVSYTAGAGLALASNQFSIGAAAVTPSMLANDATGLTRVTGGAASVTNTNVGIGLGNTTPAGKLDVGGTLVVRDASGASPRVVAGASSGSYGGVGAGFAFTTSTGQYLYTGSDFASQLNFRAGGFDFLTAPSGTANATVGFTNAMRIESSGAVGIGTNPLTGTKLDVNGNARISGALNLNGFPMVPLFARGNGLNHGVEPRLVRVGASEVANNQGRGLQLVVLRRSDLTVVASAVYDTYGTTTAADQMATAMSAYGRDSIVVVTSYDAWAEGVTTNLRTQLVRCGMSDATLSSFVGQAAGYRVPFAYVGICDSGSARGHWMITNNAANAPFAEVTTVLVQNPYTNEYSPMTLSGP